MLFVSLLVTPVTTGRKTREELGEEGRGPLDPIGTTPVSIRPPKWEVPVMPAVFSLTAEPIVSTAITYRLPRPDNTGVRTEPLPVTTEVRFPVSSSPDVQGMPSAGPGCIIGRAEVMREEVVIPTFLVGSRPHSRVRQEELPAIKE